MTSNYYSAHEEPDDFRPPQKMLKLDIEADTSKDKDFSLDDKEHVSSDATKLQKEFISNVSKTEVSLVYDELWKKLNEMENEMIPVPK